MMNLLQRQASVAPTNFSLALRQHCLQKGSVGAQLRNGKQVMVNYLPASETDAVTGKFQCINGAISWGIDANSLESRQLDIVYFVPDKDITVIWPPTECEIVALLRAA